MPNTIIYKITNKITHKIYIGKTVQEIDERIRRHLTSSRNGSGTYLHRSIRKYGFEKFDVEIIDHCEDIVSNDIEKIWIIQENSLVPNGYNMTEGGDGGDTSDSENYIKGMKRRRDYSGKNNPMYGKDSAMKGKKHKDSTIDKMSKKRKDYWTDEKKDEASEKILGENNPMYGKTPKNAIPVEIDGIIYNSIAHASRELKITVSKVKRLCKK